MRDSGGSTWCGIQGDEIMAGLALGGAITEGRLIVGLHSTLEEVGAVARSAKHTLSGELFLLDHKPTSQAIEASAAGDKAFVVDPERLGMGQVDEGMLKRIGAVIHPHGQMPNKVHAKMLVADGDRGIISSGAFYTNKGKRDDWFDLAVTVNGETARRAEALTRTTVSGDTAAFQRAAKEAAAVGVYMNDPAQGVLELAPQMRNMIENARHRLIIAVKRTDSPEFQKLLQTARDNGVDVTVHQRMTKALHGNIIVADDHAYVGSAMLNRRGLEGSGSSGRKSRELGVVVKGQLTDQIVAALEHHTNPAALAEADAAAAAAAPRGGSLLTRRNVLIAGGVTAAAGGAGAIAYSRR
ncbi:MAG: hypothetical protein JWM98_214 [Thermoleophilia bacterium]|nr:hypothetical protein [Thermoleophilia bacterium]